MVLESILGLDDRATRADVCDSLEWEDAQALAEKFRKHGAALGTRSVTDYDASARLTVEHGHAFSYRDRDTAEWRIGYFEPAQQRLTAVSEDGTIIKTHFRSRGSYVYNLPDSDYQP